MREPGKAQAGVRTGRATRHRSPRRRKGGAGAQLKALGAAGKELRLSLIPAGLPSGKGAFPAPVERLLNEML